MMNSILLRLKFGSAPWNRWRRENPDVVNGMILTGIDFSRASLAGARFSPGDLAGAPHVPASDP